MPIHDWSRVRAERFHHFHNSWIYKIADRLNGGLLPDGFYAAGEQIVGEIEPDVLTLEQPPNPLEFDWRGGAGVVAVADHEPGVSITHTANEDAYVRKQDSLTIRSIDDDRLVGVLEIVSRGNKDARRRWERFLQKSATCLSRGCHLVVVDLHPRGSFDPRGLHAAVWEYLYGDAPEPGDEGTLTLVSYRADSCVTAYLEPVDVGNELPSMPMFLDPDWYVPLPLEASYVETWQGFPEPWKAELG